MRWIGNENGEAADETWSKSILTEDNKIKNDPSQREDDFKGDPTDHFLMVMQKEINGQYRRWMPVLLRDGSGEMERVLQRVWSN